MTDQEDFEAFIKSIGIDHATLDRTRQTLPRGTPIYRPKVKIGQSGIEGEGLFAEQDFESGEAIIPLYDSRGWTEAGMKMNHSPRGNAKQKGSYIMAALPIKAGDEISCDYRNIDGGNSIV